MKKLNVWLLLLIEKKIEVKKKKYPICPCCNTPKHRTEMKVVISDMEKIDKTQFEHYKKLKVDIHDSFIDSGFDWACDACLSSKKAIRANPGLQNYCWNPHLAYFDSQFVCNTCGSDFIFEKDEKKFWFESLKFWIDSTPNHCVDCRKEIRQLKKQNKTLSEILQKNEEEMTQFELEQVIDIYSKWGKAERAKYYQSLLRKKIN